MLLLTGCGSAGERDEGDRPVVLTTFTVLQDIAQNVAGEHLRVESITKPGAEIHEYEPSFLHAKVAVVDGCWSTVGSSNLDPLSLLLAREANVVIDDREFAAGLRSALHAAMRQAGRPVQPELLARRSWHLRVLDRVAFGLMRLALWLTGHRY